MEEPSVWCRLGVQGHPWTFEDSLGYQRPCLKTETSKPCWRVYVEGRLRVFREECGSVGLVPAEPPVCALGFI